MSGDSFLDGRISLHRGDCRDVVASLAGNSVDSVVTDPPYSLVSIVKRFGKEGAAGAKSNGASGVYKRASAGFMGKTWDTGEVAFDPVFWADVLRVLKPGGHVVAFSGTRTYHRMTVAIEDGGFEIRDMIGWLYGSGFPKSHNAGEGRGTALKPAQEPICLARKPLIGTVAVNVAAYGTGAINIDTCRVNGGERVSRTGGMGRKANPVYGVFANTDTEEIVTSVGRWPANLVHDGSEEVLAAFPETTSVGHHPATRGKGGIGNNGHSGQDGLDEHHGDAGSAARFFYTAKADSSDRIGSKHPTVKPVDLMRWLCRLITPLGGTILDPFAGTGTTGEAAFYEGFNAILIEREVEYQADIERRMRLCMAGPDERARESIKAKMDGKPIDAGPLFGGADIDERGGGRKIYGVFADERLARSD